MRMVKFHHRAAIVPPSPAAELAEIIGSTQYILHADDLGADASTVGSWGPFTSEGSPVVDADGYLGSLKAVNFNGTNQSFVHPTTGLLTTTSTYTMVMAYTVPDVTDTDVRALYSFNSGATSSVQHDLEHWYSSGSLNSYVRNNGSTALNYYPAQHNPVIAIVHRTATHTRIKLYQSGNVSSYFNIAQASLTVGTDPIHAIGKRTSVNIAWAIMKLRFAALAIGQTTLDETGMNTLSTFLQTGPYNCPLS